MAGRAIFMQRREADEGERAFALPHIGDEVAQMISAIEMENRVRIAREAEPIRFSHGKHPVFSDTINPPQKNLRQVWPPDWFAVVQTCTPCQLGERRNGKLFHNTAPSRLIPSRMFASLALPKLMRISLSGLRRNESSA